MTTVTPSTSTTTTRDAPARAAGSGATTPARGTADHALSFWHVVRSEWIKLRSLRSTVWTLASTVVAMVAIALLSAWATSSAPGGDAMAAGFGGAASFAIGGYYFAQLPLVVLGVLVVTGEYSTGMVRSTFAAVPARLPALAAKALVTAAAAAVVSVVGVGLSIAVTAPFHDELGVTLDLSGDGVLRVLLGTVLYLTTITLLALGLGALVRHSAGALAAILGLLLVVETVMVAIPHDVTQAISPFLPATAGSRLLMEPSVLEMTRQAAEGPWLGPWQGYGVLAAWVVLVLGAAAVLLRRRDA